MNVPPAVMMSANAPPLMLISSAPPSQPPSVAYFCRKVSSADGAVIGIDGEVRSVPPPTVAGSAAKAAFTPLSGVLVDVTKLMPPSKGTAVQPAGMAGATTPSKPSVAVVVGCPTPKLRVNETGPRLLFTLMVSVITLPQAVAAGTV